MYRRLAYLAVLPLVLSAAGCDFSNDECLYEGASDEAPGQIAGDRNPVTGQCEYLGGSGGTGNNCGDWGGASAEPRAPRDWGTCQSYCSGLDGQTCMATAGCRAAQVSNCPEGADCDSTEYTYFECWAVAPSGPVQGSCVGLDAYQCSRHDDCISRHYPAQGCTGGTGTGDCAPGFFDPSQTGNFESCAEEPTVADGCFDNSECAAGTHCNANDVCLTPPNGCGGTGTGGTGDGVPCEQACWGYCVPDDSDAGTCTGEIACRALPPECPTNTVPGRLNGCWTGYCIPLTACDPPIDPGKCYDPAVCESVPPACPDGSVPGIANGCWTGYCVPLAQCEAPPACEAVGGEPACIARTDCGPLYEGVNCTCTEDGLCNCDSWQYSACEKN